MRYDYLVVGAGLYGAVYAHEKAKQGRSVLVIDRRRHIAGNIYTEKVGGIDWNRPVLLGYTGVSDIRLREYIEDCIASYGEKIKNLPIAKVGACIGTYAGPGAIAIAFFDKN